MTAQRSAELPFSVVCPGCAMDMVVTEIHPPGPNEPVSVTYICRTNKCGEHQYLLHVVS